MALVAMILIAMVIDKSIEKDAEKQAPTNSIHSLMIPKPTGNR